MQSNDGPLRLRGKGFAERIERASQRLLGIFAQFGSDLDATTQRLLARGSRLTELLKQAQFSPLKVEEQVVVIYAGTSGLLDPLPLDRVKEFENGLLALMRSEHKDVLDAIREKGEMTKDIDANVKTILDRYAKNFA